MDALIITLIVVAAVNAIGTVTTAIASIFWNAKIREAKDTQIQTLREMNSSRVRQYLMDQDAVLGQQIDGLKAERDEANERARQLEEQAVEEQAADNLSTKAELDEALKRVALSEALIIEMQQERDAAAVVARSSAGGLGLQRYFAQQLEDIYHQQFSIGDRVRILGRFPDPTVRNGQGEISSLGFRNKTYFVHLDNANEALVPEEYLEPLHPP